MTPREQREAIITALAGTRRVLGKSCQEVSLAFSGDKGVVAKWERGAGLRVDSLIDWANTLGMVVKIERRENK